MDVLDHLDKLKVFTIVAQKGSVSGATQELALSQPAVTRSIQALEHSLGYRLFTRDRHGMHLTEGGRIFFDESARLIRSICDAAKRGAIAEDEMVGDIRIGTFESLAEYLWPEFILKVQSDFPHLNVNLKTNSQSGHLSDLRAGVLDLLVDAEPRDYSGLTSWALYKDRFAFYSCDKISLSPTTAVNHPLLFVEKAIDEEGLSISQHLKNQGYQFNHRYTFDSFTTVKRMALRDVGIAVLPTRLVSKADNLHRIRAKHFAESFGTHQIYATVSPHRERDKRIRALVKLLKNTLKV